MTDRLRLSCADVDDLAALFVLDALGATESADVAAHLADHPDRHPAYRELAGVTPFLAETVPPVAPPPELKGRVMRQIATTPQLPAVTAIPREPSAAAPEPSAGPISLDDVRERRARRRNPLWGVLAAAAVLVIVVLGGWNLRLQQQQSESDHRTQLLAAAIAAAGQPDADVAKLTGSDAAGGASGYAVFPAGGTGWIVLTGLPEPGADQTWQAWTLADGTPASAGLMTVGSDGLAVLEGVVAVPGTTVVALTVEPAGGSEQPTTTPVVVGQLDAPLALQGTPLAYVP